MFSNTAASGANAIVSSSWKLDASHTTVAAGSSAPASELTGVPTLPATATGGPAARCMAPISSTVVVLPFVPVTAMNSFGTSRQPSSSSPTTSMPALARASPTTGASHGTPGLLTTVAGGGDACKRWIPSVSRWTSTPAARKPFPHPRAPRRACRVAGDDRARQARAARSASAAATPERASPTTR